MNTLHRETQLNASDQTTQPRTHGSNYYSNYSKNIQNSNPNACNDVTRISHSTIKNYRTVTDKSFTHDTTDTNNNRNGMPPLEEPNKLSESGVITAFSTGGMVLTVDVSRLSLLAELLLLLVLEIIGRFRYLYISPQ